ncbi:MAG: alpha/beta hydrolase family esterase [Candidatus Dormibacteria bacterium]
MTSVLRPARALGALSALALLAACGASHPARSAEQAARTKGSTTTQHQVTAGSSATPTPAPDTPSAVATHFPVTQAMEALEVNGLARQYLVIAPTGTGPATLPILLVLHGISAPVGDEVTRDAFMPLVQDGEAELVYPVGIGESWNAGGCCGPAASLGIDDESFLQDLVATVDPGRGQPIYLVGYSNGGRMAYTIACDDPSLVDGYAIVKAVPLNPCDAQAPVTLLQIAGTADWEVPYQPGDAGTESPPVTTQIALLQQSSGCAATNSTAITGTLTLEVWTSCAQGTRLGLASYAGDDHDWPPGNATTPSAASAIAHYFGVA